MSWDDAVEAFKQAMPNYEERTSQTALAHEMEAAFEAKQMLLGQAPPGTGKSYPAIIVLMNQARASAMPGVVATATKALQDQYIADCNRIKDNVFPDLRFMVLKGRGNYLCKAKMAKADETLLDLPMSVDEIDKIAETDEVLGDVERLGFELRPVQKSGLTSTSDECPGAKSCGFAKQCFAERAKAKAENAHVIIVNHALLAVDATLKAKGISILPQFPHLVVDEAHELRGYVEGALSVSLTRRGLANLTSEVANFTADLELVPAGQIAFDPLFRRLETILGRPDPRTGMTEPQPLTPAVIGACQIELMNAYEFLQSLEGAVAITEAYADQDVERKKRVRRKVLSSIEKFLKVIMDDFANTVRWVERDRINPAYGDTPPVKLCTAPLDVAPFLNEYLWQETNAIMISATLALTKSNGDVDFTYMAHEHGVDLAGDYRTFDCPSPFDFTTQAVTYIPNGMPDLRTNREAHMIMFNAQNLKLIEAAGGRSMLLFTSWSALNQSYEVLAPQLEALGYTCFKQGQMGSTRALADAFRDDKTSVLFATKSFFTGVNIEGDSLLYLGVYKAPYHFPDVLWKARCDSIDARCDDRTKWTHGSFPTLQLPDMMMTLIQGYGRLIRSMSDRGVVGIFDPALAVQGGKRYGSTVRAALPKAPLVTTYKEAADRLHELREEIERMEAEGGE